MTAQHETTAAVPAVPAGAEAPVTRAGLGRRGLIAAAAAFVAGLAARGAGEPERVSANGVTWTMPYDSGTQNTSSTLISLTNIGTGSGVSVSSTGFGVYGNTNAALNSGYAGVRGVGNGTGTYGVYGDGLGTGTGVYGVVIGSGTG